MQNIIEFYKKDVYGLEKRYVADEKMADKLRLLTGRKTLLDSDLLALTSLGFVLKEVLKPTK